MSALWGEGERVLGVSCALLAIAFAAGERAAPGVRARRATQVLGQGFEGRDRRGSPVVAKGEMAAPFVGRVPRGTQALRSAGNQDELGWRGRPRGEAAPLIVDQEAAVQALADGDATAGVGAAVRAAGDLHQARAEAHGVVVRHAAGVPTAQSVGEVAGRAAPGGRGVGRGLGQATVVVSEIRGQEGLGRRDGLDAVEAELGHEAVLQGFPEALDPALGLWGMGGDVADPEVLQDLAEVGGVLGPLELFLEAPVRVVAHEDAEAIPVEGHGQARPHGELPEQGEIPMQVLGGPEVEGEEGAGGVIDRAKQEQRRVGAEPVELAAVDEDEAAHGRAARAAGAVLRGPAPALGWPPLRPSQPADRAPADRQALDLAELLGGVAVIELAIGGLDQRQHAVPDLDVQRPGRGPTPQPVDQPPDPSARYRALRRRNCRGLIFRPWAPAAVVIVPATANCTRPGRRASLRLIVTVSHVSMGGHSYGTVKGGHFYRPSRVRAEVA